MSALPDAMSGMAPTVEALRADYDARTASA